MKHLRKFNEEILPRDKDGNPAEVLDADGNKIWSESDDLVLFALESGITTELMEVIRPFYEEHGAEFIKEYLSGVIDNFSDKEFIEDYYNLD
jgi:hypothetical protein